MRIYLNRLTAALAARTITGTLLPFGEDGQTNLGRVQAVPGALDVAPPPLVLTLEHEDTDVLGTLAVQETPDAWTATADVLPTRAGDDALAEVAAGVRACLSVEVDKPKIVGGRLVGGTITGASLVRTPAFPSARLAASAQPVAPDTDQPTSTTNPEEDPMPCQICGQIHDAGTECPTTPPAAAPQQPAGPALTAAASAGGLVAALTGTPATGPRGVTASALFAAIAGAYTRTGGEASRMTAALSDVVPADILGMEQPQYVAELWSGGAYERQIVPLLNHAPLTSFKVDGWRWKTKPAVSTYTGNKTDVPSAKIKTEAVTVNAERIAGAHDIDRKFVDFPSGGFWASYYAAMSESYKRVSDAQVLTAMKTGATPITSGAVPAGLAPGVVKVVDGALAVLQATDTVPTFALVAADLWRAVVLTRSDDVLAFLNAALGLQGGDLAGFTIRPTAQLAAGEVLVGTRSAATVHELGGEAPIRVEAPNIAQGGVDSGVFGYLAYMQHDADGLALVDKAGA